jgi:hypothetical protein
MHAKTQKASAKKIECSCPPFSLTTLITTVAMYVECAPGGHRDERLWVVEEAKWKTLHLTTLVLPPDGGFRTHGEVISPSNGQRSSSIKFNEVKTMTSHHVVPCC